MVHKALNALIQGSSADMTKKAMLTVYNETGLVPHLQVHDELDYSVESEEQANKIKSLMETCVKLKVPIKADLTLGNSWTDI
jgi:DNA polymerase I-like protein with 3'-5' exonuclease and polymerase domains